MAQKAVIAGIAPCRAWNNYKKGFLVAVQVVVQARVQAHSLQAQAGGGGGLVATTQPTETVQTQERKSWANYKH